MCNLHDAPAYSLHLHTVSLVGTQKYTVNSSSTMSMSELRSQKISPFLPLCFFFYFSAVFLPTSSPYTLPDQYFINCGSDSNQLEYGRNFVGDVNPRRFSLSSSDNSPIEDPSSKSVGLFHSARIFRRPSWYEFNIEQNGTFVVRFLFLPFPALGNISDARFSVVASGFLLLSQFTVEKINESSSLPHNEEFLITIPVGKFKVYFEPDGDNSFAFVNAIEVFVAPPDFIPHSASHVTQQGSKDNYDRLLSFPLRVIYRVNVGGPNIMPDNDTLLRSWVPDDPYLFNSEAAKNSTTYGPRPNYQSAGSTDFDAPDFVYKTAKQMNFDNGNAFDLLNITWRFVVRNESKHLLRVHFCDIISNNSNEQLQFNLYIYSQYSEVIRPYYKISQLAAPFYYDYQVDSDYSGFMNVSIGTLSESRVKNAFLNGIEIMQLIEVYGSSSDGSGSVVKHLALIISLVVGSAIIVIVILILVLLCLKRRKLKAVEAFDRPLVPFFGGNSFSRTTDKTVTGSPLVDLNLGLKLHLSEILHATKNFDPKMMIGEGGFGKVYKGTLRNGTKVAVKRSEPGSGQGLFEFQTEIMVLSKIRHNHLVSLIGYCDERGEMILVYEFMEKGTLRDHLYKTESREESIPGSTLTWDQRVRICVGAAKGIHYLHTGSSGVIIHRDIKSTNILLDEDYVAKVADFGLSRSGLRDETHVVTNVKGSFGYLDPEYFKLLTLTQKSDVYSFGVVLLEALCARPVIDQSLPRDQVSLVDWGMAWIKKGQPEEIVDPLLKGKINPDSLRKFAETAEKCLQEYGADRPNMVDVLWDLEYSIQLQHTVTPQEPYEDSTTDIGLLMPIIQRLPSHNVPIDEDESYNFTDTSQVNAGEVFSLLKIDEAR